MAKKKSSKKPVRRKAPARKSAARRSGGSARAAAPKGAPGAPAGRHTVIPQLTLRETAKATMRAPKAPCIETARIPLRLTWPKPATVIAPRTAPMPKQASSTL